MTFRQVHREERYIPLYRLVVTLRLFATHGFALTQAKSAPAARRPVSCLRSPPSALFTMAQRFFVNSP